MRIQQTGTALGFSALGVCNAEPLDQARRRLDEWLRRRYHGGMDWMERRAAVRTDPRSYFPEAQSIIVAALNYYQPTEHNPGKDSPAISMYALGRDYHKVFRKKLKTLLAEIRRLMPEARGRVCVDSFPLMEKAAAVKAGLGWIGKHTNLIRKQQGSFFFLGEILLSVELPPDPPFRADHCGSCNRCQTACPTNALDTAYVLDGRRCISYLTIEHRGPIDPELQQGVGEWVFGCDICQQVCPWNRFSKPASEAQFTPRVDPDRQTYHHLLNLDEEGFRELFQGTPVMRAGFEKFRRNVQIAYRNYCNAVEISARSQVDKDEGCQ